MAKRYFLFWRHVDGRWRKCTEETAAMLQDSGWEVKPMDDLMHNERSHTTPHPLRGGKESEA